MANTVIKKILHNGSKDYVVSVNITGDGSGEVTRSAVADVADHAALNIKIFKVYSVLNSFGGILAWDSDTTASRRQALVLPVDRPMKFGFAPIGGLQNTVSASKINGSITLTTVGLGSGEVGTLVLWCKKS